MKNPSLKARAAKKHETSPDIETMHARLTAREDRSAWKRLNIRIPEDELTELQIHAKKAKPKTTAENIALDLLRKYMAEHGEDR